MDKTTRLILGVAVLVIFPTLVIIGAVQFINFADTKKPITPTYPDSYADRPDCTDTLPRESNLYSTSSYTKCLEQQEAYREQYTEEMNKYEEEMKINQEKYKEYYILQQKETALRSISVLLVSLITLVIGYKIREIKELAGSLVVASSLMITGSTIILAELTQKNVYPKVSNFLTIFTFFVVVYLMYLIEKTKFHKNSSNYVENSETKAAMVSKDLISKDASKVVINKNIQTLGDEQATLEKVEQSINDSPRS